MKTYGALSQSQISIRKQKTQHDDATLRTPSEIFQNKSGIFQNISVIFLRNKMRPKMCYAVNQTGQNHKKSHFRAT